MSMKIVRWAGSRRTRLTQKISKHIEREHPERKRRRYIHGAVIVALIALNHLCDKSSTLTIVWFSLLAAYLVYAEVSRLRNKAPRPRWRDLTLESAVGTVVLLGVALMMATLDPSDPEAKGLAIAFAAFGGVFLVLFGYALRRFILLKREIAEEKEQIRRREQRRKKLAQL